DVRHEIADPAPRSPAGGAAILPVPDVRRRAGRDHLRHLIERLVPGAGDRFHLHLGIPGLEAVQDGRWMLLLAAHEGDGQLAGHLAGRRRLALATLAAGGGQQPRRGRCRHSRPHEGTAAAARPRPVLSAGAVLLHGLLLLSQRRYQTPAPRYWTS